MQLDWQGLEAAGTLVAAGATVMTLGYGIKQYNNQELARIFSQLRDDCGQLEQGATRIDGLLNDACFTVLAQHLVDSLDNLVPTASSAAEYIDHLERIDGSLIATAMIPASYTLSLLEVAERHQDSLGDIAARQSEYFPALKRILVVASLCLTNVAGEMLGSRLPRRIFEEDGFYDPKQFWATTRGFAQSAANVPQARLAVARSLAALSRQFYDRERRETFDSARAIIRTITERVAKASTQELKSLRLSAKTSERSTQRIISKTASFTAEIPELARSIRRFLGKETYAEITRLCDELDEPS